MWRGPPRKAEEREKCLTLAAPLNHREVVMVCRPQARDQPEAKEVKLGHDGARKMPENHAVITVPNDEAKKVSTVMSSVKSDCLA